ncbi:DNA methyltransferase [Amycolatopsis sp. NPDC004079]|uniref:DNA methyltransferase n=1 Tax=Amycolatopsis sp. NPDC004079 TaxID=3154549 RepID=UPI0033A0CD89
MAEAENLEALRAWENTHRGAFDLVLADPPFNAGNYFWSGPDGTGLVEADDPDRHEKWIRFLRPRIEAARALLRPGGVLAVCVDHRELFRLGLLLDTMLGEGNRLALISWEHPYTPSEGAEPVCLAVEHVLAYVHDPARETGGAPPPDEAKDPRYARVDGDPRFWRPAPLRVRGPLDGSRVAIQSPFTGRTHRPLPGSWATNTQALQEELGGWGCPFLLARDADGPIARPAADAGTARSAAEGVLARGSWPRVHFGQSGQDPPQLKVYLEELKRGLTGRPTGRADGEPPAALGAVHWSADEIPGPTGAAELGAILGPGHGFAARTVKPTHLFERLIALWCPTDGSVLDPFAGSGTTGHAVLRLNRRTGAQRTFLLIEQGFGGPAESVARRLTAARLRRVLDGAWDNGSAPPLDGGFAFLTAETATGGRNLTSRG